VVVTDTSPQHRGAAIWIVVCRHAKISFVRVMEDVIGGDDGNMIAVGTFSVTVDAQVTHEDDPSNA
jgi:hypothetical protein